MTNVLVVDAERVMRSTLKERLEYEGYVVDTAQSRSEAMGKLERTLNSSYKCNGIHINNLFKFFVWCEVSKSFTRSII